MEVLSNGEVLIIILTGLCIIGSIITFFSEIPKFLGQFSKLIEEEKYGGVEGSSTTDVNADNNNSQPIKKDG